MREIVSISKKMIIISIILLVFISGIVIAKSSKEEYPEEAELGKNYKIAGKIEDSEGNVLPGCKIELVRK